MKRQQLKRKGFRFWLRPYEVQDGYAIFQAANESRSRVGAWMDWLTPSYTVHHSIEWARNVVAGWDSGLCYEFAIIDSADGELAGCCGLNRINYKDLVCNLGYWVRESKIRKGAAWQATELLKDFGLNVIGFNRIEIVVGIGNTASQKVAEKAGAIYEGIQRMRIRIGDRPHDAHMYALLAQKPNV